MNQKSGTAIDVLLAESLKELAAARPIEKITIKEITDRAGVIRPTFYNHFQDKYELIEWIISNDLITPVLPLLDRDMVREAVLMVLRTMKSEQAFYIQAAHLDGQNSFSGMMKKAFREVVLHYADRDRIAAETRYSWLTPEMLADFYAESMGYVICRWVLAGMKESESELADVFLFLYTHSVPEVISGGATGDDGSR